MSRRGLGYVPESVDIPDFGPARTTQTVNKRGCVDPRKFLTFVQLGSGLAEHFDGPSTIIRSHNPIGAVRNPG
jgi:hypothetical protein